MLFSVLVGLVAGVLTSLSPCVLPVLPVVLTASLNGADSSGAAAHDDTGRRKRSWRPYGVVTLCSG
jgi:cytochrome c biogenesis protein CcdA